MPWCWYKYADEIELPYADFKNRLASGDQVSTAVCTAYDEDDTDVSASMIDGSPVIEDKDSDSINERVTIKIKAGTAGNWYKVEFLATTANGEKKKEVCFIRVREESI